MQGRAGQGWSGLAGGPLQKASTCRQLAATARLLPQALALPLTCTPCLPRRRCSSYAKRTLPSFVFCRTGGQAAGAGQPTA